MSVEENSRTTRERSFENPTERALVIQFDSIEGARSRFRGRVEVVASGEATHFLSLKQLVGFMAGALRRRAAGAQGSDL
jgi:hypothetical protein